MRAFLLLNGVSLVVRQCVNSGKINLLPFLHFSQKVRTSVLYVCEVLRLSNRNCQCEGVIVHVFVLWCDSVEEHCKLMGYRVKQNFRSFPFAKVDHIPVIVNHCPIVPENLQVGIHVGIGASLVALAVCDLRRRRCAPPVVAIWGERVYPIGHRPGTHGVGQHVVCSS